MNVDFGKLREVFLEAVEQHDPETWPAFLDRACAGSPALRAEVELLLQAHVRGEHAAPSTPPSWIGRQIGPYTLLEQIGEGGMGTVYMAEQSEPIKRRVAVKIIRPGLDSRQVIARFEVERQLLALMDHPNIARVLDAGTTQSGEPYFVMELIKGTPITKFCDERRLTPRERLGLFIPVCRAIQHAHQKGIIHRDLKPSNVMIALYDGQPVPKVIDFGVAKAVSQPLAEWRAMTGFGAIIGTLEYMSPEQAELNQLDVDARSDIYGLGVLLYELLTGTTPLLHEQIRCAANLEILRLIREESPPLPSARLSTTQELPSIAANRGLDPARLSGTVRGELDWIVMRCLEKDRGRRYASADGLARELERYLADEPVEACPPSTRYRLAKFARKHRVGLSTAAGFLALILAGAAVATWFGIRATRAEARAREQAEIAQAMNAFIQDDLLASANPNKSADRDLKLRTVLDRASRRVRSTFAGQPLVEAGLDRTMGVSFSSLGEYVAAETLLVRSAELYERVRGPRHLETLMTRIDLGIVYFREGRLDDARRLEEDNVATLRETLGPTHEATLRAVNNLVNVVIAQGHFEDARRLIEADLPALRAAFGDEAPTTLGAELSLARVNVGLGRFEEAQAIDEKVLSVYRRNLGPEHPRTLIAMNNLATVLKQQGHLGEARELYVETLDAKRKTLGAEHPSTLIAIYNLADLELSAGEFEQARVHYQEALAGQRRVLGNEHSDTLRSMMGLGLTLERLGEPQAARRLYEETLTTQRKVLGAEHPDTFRTMLSLAQLDRHTGRYGESRELYEQALSGRRRALGPRHPDSLNLSKDLACWLATDPAVAFRDPTRSLQLAREALVQTPDDGGTWNTRGVAEYRLGEWSAAESALAKSMELRAGGDANDYFFMAMCEWQLGHRDEARSWYRRGADDLAKNHSGDADIERFRDEAEQLLHPVAN